MTLKPFKKIDMTGKISGKFIFIIIIASLAISCHAKNNPLKSRVVAPTNPERLEGSPYPMSESPFRLYVVKDQNFSNNQLLTIETLQGVLAQTKPQIYRLRSGGYGIWMEDLRNNYGVTLDYTYQSDFSGLLDHFKNDISGYILCNSDDPSVNVAISMCGIKKAVAVTPEDEHVLKSLNLPEIKDVRGLDEKWFFNNYGDKITKKIFCYQKESKFAFLGDYAVFGKMITFFKPIGSDLTNRIFSAMTANSALFGWGDDEYQLVKQSSPHDIMVHAADWAANLSTLTNFKVDVHQRAKMREITPEENVHTVCFVMTDGDNIQWVLNDFATNRRWYGCPDRSKVKLGWTISPALYELAPTVLKYIYDHAENSENGKDYFIASPSGLGYIFPDDFKDMQGYCELTSRFMEKTDLRIVNVIGNSKSKIYLKPYLDQPNIDAVFFYYYSNYAAGRGTINWINGKPVIAARYNLWDGVFDTPSTLANRLNNLSRDIHSPGGYSLIPVHVWTDGVDQVLDCVNRLKKDVRVVTPDEFVALIKQNINH